MDGVQFFVDEKGEKKSVLLDLRKHRGVWEDIYDTLIAKSRAKEPRESLAEVKKLLKQRGKLGASV